MTRRRTSRAFVLLHRHEVERAHVQLDRVRNLIAIAEQEFEHDAACTAIVRGADSAAKSLRRLFDREPTEVFRG